MDVILSPRRIGGMPVRPDLSGKFSRYGKPDAVCVEAAVTQILREGFTITKQEGMGDT